MQRGAGGDSGAGGAEPCAIIARCYTRSWQWRSAVEWKSRQHNKNKARPADRPSLRNNQHALFATVQEVTPSLHPWRNAQGKRFKRNSTSSSGQPLPAARRGQQCCPAPDVAQDVGHEAPLQSSRSSARHAPDARRCRRTENSTNSWRWAGSRLVPQVKLGRRRSRLLQH